MISAEFLHEKGIRDLNEDAVLCDNERQVYGVFDGASSLVNYLSPDGKTGGYIASHIVRDVFSSADGALIEIARSANEAINQRLVEGGIDLSSNLNRFGTTAAVVRIAGDTAELFQCGDSVIIARFKDGTVTTPLGYVDQDIDIMRLWRQYVDARKDNVKELLRDEIHHGREQANIGYGTMNGDPRSQNHFQSIKLQCTDLRDILIVTDGMFIPKSDPDADEDWQEYFRVCDDNGLSELYDYVRHLELSDPDLTKYPRFKIHDDASAVLVSIG